MLIPRARAGSAGVTLIELVVAITILGIAISMGLPSYHEWIQNTRIRNGAESVLRGLELARSEAISRNVPVQLSLSTDAGVMSGWTVGCETVTATCPATIQNGSTAAVKLTVADNKTLYVFDGFGRMTAPDPDGGKNYKALDVDSTVLAAAKSRDLRITVFSNGMARMCDPNVSGENDTRKCPA